MSTIKLAFAYTQRNKIYVLSRPFTIPEGGTEVLCVPLGTSSGLDNFESVSIKVQDHFSQGKTWTVVDGLAQHHHFRDVQHNRFQISGEVVGVGQGCLDRMENYLVRQGVERTRIHHLGDYEFPITRPAKGTAYKTVRLKPLPAMQFWTSSGQLQRIWAYVLQTIEYYDIPGVAHGYNAKCDSEFIAVARRATQTDYGIRQVTTWYHDSDYRDTRSFANKSYTEVFNTFEEAYTAAYAAADRHLRDLSGIYRDLQTWTDGIGTSDRVSLDDCITGSFDKDSLKSLAEEAVAYVTKSDGATLDIIPWQDIAASAIGNVSDQAFTGNGIAYVKDALTMKGFMQSLAELSAKMVDDVDNATVAFHMMDHYKSSGWKSMARKQKQLLQRRKDEIATDAANEYLSNHYGTRLTVADTVDLAKSWNSTNFGGLYGLQRAQSQHTHHYMYDGFSVERTARYCCYYRPKMADPQLYEFLNLYDLNPTLGNLWDMVPYSFVVDWFANIGTLLETIDSDYRLKTEYNVELREQSIKKVWTSSSWKYGLLGGNARVTTYRRFYSPTAIEADWLSVVSLSTPSSHWLEGAALVIQHI